MKLQFNLLPDVKQEFLKTQRTKRSIVLAACMVAGVSVFIMLAMMSTVYVVNKNQLSDADKEVKKYSKELQNIPNIDRILTVQNQLKSLATLHQEKKAVSKLYTYLPQVTPTNVKMGKISINFLESNMIIEGTTDTHKSVNTFVDTLKFTKYKLDGKSTGKNAFSSVIESQFGLSEKGASYEIILTFDPSLFSNTQKIELEVPRITTTRSALNDPSNILFNGETPTTQQQNPAGQGQGGTR